MERGSLNFAPWFDGVFLKIFQDDFLDVLGGTQYVPVIVNHLLDRINSGSCKSIAPIAETV